jgi:hypothetical protein
MDDAECATTFCNPGTQTCQPGTVTPRYLENVCETSAGNDLIVTTDRVFDSDVDVDCTGGIVGQANGPSICILRHGVIRIAPGVSFRVTGTRSIALVADTLVSVSGTLDVSASNFTNGAGGGVTTSGGQPGTTDGTGGGGAGFKTAGGSGGNSASAGGAANAGQAGSSALAILSGGPRAAGNGGGGGGGALT